MTAFIRSILLSLASSSLLAGCAYAPYSETPIATNFAVTKQLKLQSANQWQVITDDMTRKLLADYTSKVPLYIEPMTQNNDFNRAFINHLITSLTSQGQVVLKEPIGSHYLVEVDIQTVRFAPDREQASSFYTKDNLMTGVSSEDTWRAKYADRFINDEQEFASGMTPQHEIIVTLGISNQDQYAIRKTATYYLADADKSLYLPKRSMNRTYSIAVKGGE